MILEAHILLFLRVLMSIFPYDSTNSASRIISDINDPENHSSPTNQQTSSQNHTNNHAKIGIESLPRKDKSVCDQPAALKRTPTENPQAKAKSTKKKRVCSNSDSTGNEGDNTTKKKRKATEKDLFYNSSTEDTISPKSVDLDGLMKNFGAQKRIG